MYLNTCRRNDILKPAELPALCNVVSSTCIEIQSRWGPDGVQKGVQYGDQIGGSTFCTNQLYTWVEKGTVRVHVRSVLPDNKT